VEFAICILGYGDWETVGDHNEMLRVGDVWDLGDVRLGGGSWNGHDGTVLREEIGETFGCEDISSGVRLFILAYIRQALIADGEDNPDISRFPYPVFRSPIPAGSSKSRVLFFQLESKFSV
jgi:hypothetical protein